MLPDPILHQCLVVLSPIQNKFCARDPPLEGEERQDILAYEQHIYGAEIEFVVIRESSKTIISRMHSSIKLQQRNYQRLLLDGFYVLRHTITVFPLYWMM